MRKSSVKNNRVNEEVMRELAEEYGKGKKTKDDLVTFGKGVIDRILGGCA